MKRRQVGLSVSPKRVWLESRMTPRAGNETARSVQLIGVGLSEVLIRPGQGVVSFPWSGKEVAGCSPDRDLALISLTRSIAARAPSMSPWTTAFSFGIARATRTVGKTIP